MIVDKGYQGHDYQGEATVHVVRTIPKRATRAVRRMLKRRAAIEPTIGHLKSDNRLSRNHLSGKMGDRINTLLAAAGYNLRKLLRWIIFSLVSALLQPWETRIRLEMGHQNTPTWPTLPSTHLPNLIHLSQ